MFFHTCQFQNVAANSNNSKTKIRVESEKFGRLWIFFFESFISAKKILQQTVKRRSSNRTIKQLPNTYSIFYEEFPKNTVSRRNSEKCLIRDSPKITEAETIYVVHKILALFFGNIFSINVFICRWLAFSSHFQYLEYGSPFIFQCGIQQIFPCLHYHC